MRPKNLSVRALLLVATATVLLAAACGTEDQARPAGTPEPPSTLVAFNGAAREFTEGVAVDSDGNVFVSITPQGRLVRIAAGTTQVEDFGKVEGLQEGDFGLLGLAVDDDDNVYGAVVSKNPAANGVWRFDAGSGAAERLAGTEKITFANEVAVDGDNVYVSDTRGPGDQGAVWRVPADGAAEVWAQGGLLAGNGSFDFGFPLGANGIEVHEGTVYVGVTEGLKIVAIPIEDDGTAGDVSTFVDVSKVGPGGGPAAVDGVDVDDDGSVYFTAPVAHVVMKVSSNGQDFATVADASDNLDGPSSVAIGEDAIYIANFSAALGESSNMKGPSIVRVPI